MVRNLARNGPGELRVELIHRVGRPGDQYFAAGIDVGVDQAVDGLVGAVGEQQLFGAYAQPVRNLRDGLGVLGVDGEEIGVGDPLEQCRYARRAADGVFVEVEA